MSSIQHPTAENAFTFHFPKALFFELNVSHKVYVLETWSSMCPCWEVFESGDPALPNEWTPLNMGGFVTAGLSPFKIINSVPFFSPCLRSFTFLHGVTVRRPLLDASTLILDLASQNCKEFLLTVNDPICGILFQQHKVTQDILTCSHFPHDHHLELNLWVDWPGQSGTLPQGCGRTPKFRILEPPHTIQLCQYRGGPNWK